MPAITVQMPPQLYIASPGKKMFGPEYEHEYTGPSEEWLSPERFQAPRNVPFFPKPRGGLWTSTYDSEYGCDWIRWCLGERYMDPPYEGYLLHPHIAKIFVIDTLDDLRELLKDYRVKQGLPAMPEGMADYPDFEALAEDYDAIHLTAEGQWRTRLTSPNLYGWDCESTLWLRWSFERVDYLGLLDIRDACWDYEDNSAEKEKRIRLGLDQPEKIIFDKEDSDLFDFEDDGEFQENPVTRRFYHGTLANRVDSVLENGLEPQPGWVTGSRGVFMSSSPEGATYWAKLQYQAEHDGVLEAARFDRDIAAKGLAQDEVITLLAVDIPETYLSLLRADMEQEEDYGVELDPLDWEESINVSGDVMYAGRIPPSWISFATRENPSLKAPSIENLVRQVGKKYPGFGGNCGMFAYGVGKALKEAMPRRSYTIGFLTEDISGKEYLRTGEPFVHHVFLIIGRTYYDATGKIDRAYLKRFAIEEENDHDAEIYTGFPLEKSTLKIIDEHTAWKRHNWEKYYRAAKRILATHSNPYVYSEYPKPIEISLPNGSLSGVIHNDREYLSNWLDSRRADNTARTTLSLISDQMLLPIACINNMWVDEPSRGEGVGSTLMEMFFSIIDGEAVTAILEVDTGQEQEDGFNLESWYSKYDFVNISNKSNYPIMLWTETDFRNNPSNSSNEIFTFLGPCDRLRMHSPENEDRWQEMMRRRIPVTADEMEDACELETLLEEGETLDEFGAGDPDRGYYRSVWGDSPCMFIQTHGFEFIFVPKTRHSEFKVQRSQRGGA